MFSFVSGSTHVSPYLERFVAELNRYDQENRFFDDEHDIFLARAPGRLDLMGGIADYSGSLVLQYPLAVGTLAAIQKVSAPEIRIVSRNYERELTYTIGLAEMDEKLGDYNAARQFFRQNTGNHWAAYVVGVFLVLQQERGINFAEGARISIFSNVPEGKGVSSSAALETATMQAVKAAFDLDLNPRELALLCQTVENKIVGAPCGVMDQMVSSCGEVNKLLALRCQPAEIEGSVELPAEIEIWGIDSGIRHSVAGADYGSVRAGAFIGYRIIAEIAGLEVEKRQNNLVEIRDEKWRGYLANVTPEEFEANFKAKLPEKIRGGDFLRNYHGTIDKITKIEPEKEYAVLAPTVHPIYENHRVEKFARLLTEEFNDTQMHALGELMFQSHESYSACGLGSDGTDLLVELVKNSGAESGLYGAKITGGGSGGTIAVLGRKGTENSVKIIADQYRRETGHDPQIFSGSSPGADQSGVSVLRRNNFI